MIKTGDRFHRREPRRSRAGPPEKAAFSLRNHGGKGKSGLKKKKKNERKVEEEKKKVAEAFLQRLIKLHVLSAGGENKEQKGEEQWSRITEFRS